MQIQRIQTVYIFLALVAMSIFLAMPYGSLVAVGETTVEYHRLTVTGEWSVMIPAGVSALLLLADIFFYRNLSLQRRVLKISLLLTLAVIVTVCFALYRQGAAEGIAAHVSAWDILLLISILFEILGIRGINHDIKLLNSYNRLR